MLIFVLFAFAYFGSWVFCRFMCEYKYYWCKGDCVNCHNWKCKYFKKKSLDDNLCSYEKCLICEHQDCWTGKVARDYGINGYHAFLDSLDSSTDSLN